MAQVYEEPSMKPSVKRQKTLYVTGNGPSTKQIHQDYIIGKLLGTPGNFGQAKLCVHRKTQEKFAVKVIEKSKLKHCHHEGIPSLFTDMQNEINILKQLQHPNIVEFHECFEDRNHLFIVMEYCCGGELFERISQKGSFSENEAAQIMIQIFESLKFLHKNRIVHCDLKPDNFLFKEPVGAKDPVLKVIDFGMSKRLAWETKLNQLCGTPYYTAPEVIKSNYTTAADMWSVGVIMFVMIFGYPPFYADPAIFGKKENEMIYKKIRRGFNPEVKKGYGAHFPKDIPISEDARDLIGKLLTSKPQDRLTAREALEHPWIVNRNRNKQMISRNVLKAIRGFKQKSNFSKRVAAFFNKKGGLPDAKTKKLKEVIKSFDKNNDGKISKAEFGDGLKKFMAVEDHKVIDALFNDLDQDCSSYLEYDELLNAMILEHVQSEDERLYALFTEIDKNGDGKITVEEIRVAFDIEDIKVAEDLLSQADKNKDGFIDYLEFLSMMHPDVNHNEKVPLIYTNQDTFEALEQKEEELQREVNQLQIEKAQPEKMEIEA